MKYAIDEFIKIEKQKRELQKYCDDEVIESFANNITTDIEMLVDSVDYDELKLKMEVTLSPKEMQLLLQTLIKWAEENER